MVIKRLKREYGLDINNNVVVKYGTLDKENPKVVYVTCKGYITPIEKFDYDSAIDDIINCFKKKLRHTLRKSIYFENKFICDFDLKSVTMEYNKKNYFMVEFYVRQLNNNIVGIKEVDKYLIETFSHNINDLIKQFNDNTFIVTKTKR